ncbi:unnamed protein product [Rotaria socialis]|uniref:Reverse transcriptase/retrotransposon-derived protein RNase H-like domain-containing protein n=1 Tax=Rotaria socialis TaxID=392032 RepID=A0A820CW61_9BILA|nr:unnamed protein product [Rotaria socialis]
MDYSLAQGNICNLIQPVTNSEQKDKIKRALDKHVKLFDTTKPTIVINVKPHAIKTLDHSPPSSKPYYSTPTKQDAMYMITQELLQFELIRPSYSPYAAPALLVAKHDVSWRMVVDNKKLNNITIKDNHPLPNMEQTIQTLGGGYQFFSKFDMKSGFWQIPIRAFITPEGLYEWNVLAQGLKNSPLSFQRVIADILSSCHQFALVYIDDYPDEDHPVILATDASKTGVGGTLQQPINEALAIWLCFQRMRSYLLGRSIIICADHCPLCKMMTSSVKNPRVDRQNNCLAGYLSRHPIQPNEEIFDEDYGISMLFQGKPPAKVTVSVNNSQFIGAVITRSKTKQILQQQDTINATNTFIKNESPSSSSTQDTDKQQNELSSHLISSNMFDITKIKEEQLKDSFIQNKIKEIMADPTKYPYVFKDGVLYKLMSANATNTTKTKLIYLPSSMINSLLQSYHNDPLRDHFDIRRTYFKIKNKL